MTRPSLSVAVTRPSLSVVVCAYTLARWSLLQAALRSVLRQDRPADDVVLVVDHCRELERRARAAFAEEPVTVVGNDRRPGLSGARNAGIAASTGEVVVFLDDDAVAEPGWLAAHARHYDDPDVLGVGGRVVPEWDGTAPGWFPDEFGWVVGCSYTGQPTVSGPVRNPIGANMSFRRSVFQAVGGFQEELGRVATAPAGCEETELSIRAARTFPAGRIVHEPAAVVRHHVSGSRMRWSYFRRRCWSEGVSKARVSALADPRSALATERSYVTATLRQGVRGNLARAGAGDLAALGRATAICAGLGITTAGYLAGRLRTLHSELQGDHQMNAHNSPDPGWLNFDVHGRVGIRVAAGSPAAAQLATMLACFATRAQVPGDLTVTAEFEPLPQTAQLEDQLEYTADSVAFPRDCVQIVRDGGRFRISGPGELLTALVPVLDRAMVERGAAMIHAATVGYRGYAVALPAAGGTGKTSTVAKLMRKEGYSFMGDDWAFLADDSTLLGYEKPMFIKPHHRPIYPHLFSGVRKPMVPSSLSRPVGRLTTAVHPFVIRYPRLADVSRRWSPEHRMVDASRALPGVPVTSAAPLLAAVYVERFGGDTTRLVEQSQSWMVDRMLGNFHIEMASFSQRVVTAMAATSMISWRELIAAKGDVLSKGVDGIACYLLQVPAAFSADRASDEVVRVLDDLLPPLLAEAGGRR